jgi:hypothetical protein
VLRHPSLTVGFTLLTIALTGYLFYAIPKGFFPIEDTGFIIGGTETAEDTSYAGMLEKQLKLEAVFRANPYVTAYNLEVSLGGSRFGINSGDLYVQLKPRNQRPPITEVIQDLRRQAGAIPGLNVFLNPAQNLQIGARASKSIYQYTLQAGNLEELYRFAPLVDAEMRRLSELQDVSSDLQIKSPQTVLNVDREKAAALGLTAEQISTRLYNSFGSRQVATIYTGSNDYAVILEFDSSFPRHRRPREPAKDPVQPIQPRHSHDLQPGPRSPDCKPSRATSCCDDCVQLAARRIAWGCDRANPGHGEEADISPHHHGELLGNRASVPAVVARPRLVVAGDRRGHLHRARHPL